MTTLQTVHLKYGANLNTDGIPLDYGNLVHEYAQLEQGAILLDRSHEGRVILRGDTRLELINRISTNKVIEIAPLAGVPTLFTNANARIIDRIEAYNLPEALWLLTSPGRGAHVHTHLTRNIFFNDKATASDHTAQTHQFDLHGATANTIVARLTSTPPALYRAQSIQLAEHPVWLFHRAPKVGGHWSFICSATHAPAVYETLLQAGAQDNLTPSGSLVFNALRIRAGVAGNPELNGDYIPLELGLWDEVSFHKGCYTGQEVIARMDSREKLARVMVSLELSQFVASPHPIFSENKPVGQLTSSVIAPDGKIHAIAILKVAYAHANNVLEVGTATTATARVLRLLGTQPAWVTQNE